MPSSAASTNKLISEELLKNSNSFEESKDFFWGEK
jgi:hypothetical protein